MKSTVDGEINADVDEMEFPEKSRLIQSDPVTCARYFNHRFNELKKSWSNTTEGAFGEYKIAAMYHRIEFQHRGK